MSRVAIEPWFVPGSGWYVPAACAPGSLADVEGRNRAAYRCVVFLLRHEGAPMEPDSVMAALRYDGALICERSHTKEDAWDAALFSPPAMSNAYLRLWDVRLVRLRGHIRQYQGLAWDRKGERQVPQTWLCVPDAETGLRVVNQMPRPANRSAFARTVAAVLNPAAGRL